MHSDSWRNQLEWPRQTRGAWRKETLGVPGVLKVADVRAGLGVRRRYEDISWGLGFRVRVGVVVGSHGVSSEIEW